MSIRRLSCVIALVCVLVFHPVAASAKTPSYDAIYVFGDSYCDVGNIFIASGKTQPLAPYFNGRFSNGPLWVDHLASSMNLPMAPALSGGTDYAFGGAHVTGPVPTPTGSIPSIPQQVLLYLSQHGGKADPNALYIIEGGGNDIIDATGGSPQQLGFQIALGLSTSELLLRQAGARNFLIPNLFDISLVPAGSHNAAFAHQASLTANKTLNDLLAIDQLLQGMRIHRIDVFTLFQSIVADATHFGFTDITNPCFNTTTRTICADPDHTLFWDTVHPTVFGHSFFTVLSVAALSQ